MSQDELSPNRVNVEYYRKLNQQLVQKDNIIKILQLKLKNLESNQPGPGPIAAGGGSEGGSRLPALPDDDDGPRPAPDEEEPRNRMRRGAGAGGIQESETQKALIEELKGQIVSLKAQLSAKEGEVRDARDKLEKAKGPGSPKELERQVQKLNRELDEKGALIDQLRAELHQRELSENVRNMDPLLTEEIEEKDQTIQELRAEAARLREGLEEMRALVRGYEREQKPLAAGIPQASLTHLLGLLAEAGSIKNELTEQQLPSWARVESRLSEIAARLGVERIRTVGQGFDPRVHQAVETMYSTAHAHNTVIREVSPGFMAGEGIVRLADVAINLNPNYCTACETIVAEGSSFCNLCGSRLAYADAERRRVLDPASAAQSHLDLARSFEDSGDLDMARAHLDRALEVDDDLIPAISSLARLAERQGLFDEALAHLDRLKDLSANPLDTENQRRRIESKREILVRLISLY